MKKFDFSSLRTPFLFQAAVDLTQPQFTPLTDVKKSPIFTGVFSSGSLPEFFNALFTFALSAGGILAVIMIAYGGFLYLWAGADNPGTLTKAKNKIRGAIIGLVLLLSIYLILYQINPQLLNLDIFNSVSKETTTAPVNDTGFSTGGGF